jgi:hypothetical protein
VRVAVGALLYHLDDQLIRVVNVGATTDLAPATRTVVIVRLLDCAQQIARAHGCDRLEWLVHSADAAKSACASYEFQRVRRNDRRCRSLRGNDVLLERR